MIQLIEHSDFREIIATEGYIHRIGSNVYSEIRRQVLLPQDSVDIYEEITELPKFSEEEYEAKVEARIRERYSVSAELAILRQRDTKPDEFAEYNAYAERCKAESKAALADGKE